MVITPHPLHSLDLAPCDFALYPKLKMTSTELLKGRKEDGIVVHVPKRHYFEGAGSQFE
jgi:hypothetical protein